MFVQTCLSQETFPLANVWLHCELSWELDVLLQRPVQDPAGGAVPPGAQPGEAHARCDQRPRASQDEETSVVTRLDNLNLSTVTVNIHLYLIPK